MCQSAGTAALTGYFVDGDCLASYHFSAQIIGRASGRSSVAAAAYRAGARLRDERSGQEHDYSNRRGVAHSEILLPEGAAPWLADRVKLWNHVERIEKRRDAQLAREINIALPHEIGAEERLSLVRGFVREQFVSRGMVADIAWHEPVPAKGDDPRNFHAHIMLTLRQAQADGLRAVKTREWNSDTLMEEWRAAWAMHQNRFLLRGGHRDQVDHRSLRVQRQEAERRGDRQAAETLAREPEIHIGPKARAAERKERVVRQSRDYVRATARPAGGVWYSAPAATGRRQRTLDYRRIDRGSRMAFNADRISVNMRGVFHKADRLERLAARLRARELRAMRLLTVAGLPAHERARYGLTITPARLKVARKHKARTSSLLRDIERILASLFHVRDLWGVRYRDLLRLRPHELERGRSRGRD
jgi:hypothetical protein